GPMISGRTSGPSCAPGAVRDVWVALDDDEPGAPVPAVPVGPVDAGACPILIRDVDDAPRDHAGGRADGGEAEQFEHAAPVPDRPALPHASPPRPRRLRAPSTRFAGKITALARVGGATARRTPRPGSPGAAATCGRSTPARRGRRPRRRTGYRGARTADRGGGAGSRPAAPRRRALPPTRRRQAEGVGRENEQRRKAGRDGHRAQQGPPRAPSRRSPRTLNARSASPGMRRRPAPRRRPENFGPINNRRGSWRDGGA